MKRFLLFGGDRWYARGGFLDLITHADSKEEGLQIIEDLIKKHEKNPRVLEWWQIVDTETREIVATSKDVAVGSINSYDMLHKYKDGVLVVQNDDDY